MNTCLDEKPDIGECINWLRNWKTEGFTHMCNFEMFWENNGLPHNLLPELKDFRNTSLITL